MCLERRGPSEEARETLMFAERVEKRSHTGGRAVQAELGDGGVLAAGERQISKERGTFPNYSSTNPPSSQAVLLFPEWVPCSPSSKLGFPLGLIWEALLYPSLLTQPSRDTRPGVNAPHRAWHHAWPRGGTRWVQGGMRTALLNSHLRALPSAQQHSGSKSQHRHACT